MKTGHKITTWEEHSMHHSPCHVGSVNNRTHKLRLIYEKYDL